MYLTISGIDIENKTPAYKMVTELLTKQHVNAGQTNAADKIAEMLISAGANVNAEDDENNTPLAYAVTAGKFYGNFSN